MHYTKNVPFIGREEAISLIKETMNQVDTSSSHILYIMGEGGLGKTRILQEIPIFLKQTECLCLEIVDFDDYLLLVEDGLELRLHRILQDNGYASSMWPKLQRLHIMRKRGDTPETQDEQQIRVLKALADDFAHLAQGRHLVFLYDTIEKLNPSTRSRLMEFISYLRNTFCILAGRPEGNNAWVSSLDQKLTTPLETYKLLPFTLRESRAYLNEKQKYLGAFNSQQFELYSLLAEGRPVFIDLLVDYITLSIPFGEMSDISAEEFERLPSLEQDTLRRKFKERLVHHITQIRNPLDRLVLILSRTYPLTVEMATKLLGSNAQDLFGKVENIAFIKILPGEPTKITLHDEMRALVNTYVWPQIDPLDERRKRDSALAVQMYEKQSQVNIDNHEDLRKKLRNAENDNPDRVKLEYDLEESRHKRDVITKQWVKHALYANFENGVDICCKAFDETTQGWNRSIQKDLLDLAEQYMEKLSPEQWEEYNFRRAQYWSYARSHEDAYNALHKSINNDKLTHAQMIDTLILLGNIQIRLGQVKVGHKYFKNAEEVAERTNDNIPKIKVKNALGWVHRLLSERDKAIGYYIDAEMLCNKSQEKGDILGDILNNLTFVLSRKDVYHATEYGQRAEDFWKKRKDIVGLGAAHHALGCVHYQGRQYTAAEDKFRKALIIFEDEGEDEWVGRTLSWRGALYQDWNEDRQGGAPNHLEKARKYLELAVTLEPGQTKAMTLNRLGRVYMSNGDWKGATEILQNSLEVAQKIPDYVYWLGSIARLATIAAERRAYSKLSRFEDDLKNYYDKIEIDKRNVDLNSLGILHFALARLALGNNNIPDAKKYLELGIVEVTDYGSYAHTGVRLRLQYVESDFKNISAKIVHELARYLRPIFEKKQRKDMRYNTVVAHLYDWENWLENKERDE